MTAGFCSALFFGSSCATVAHGRTQGVTVTSEPSGAQVFVKSQLVGVTPTRLDLKRRDPHIVLRLEKDGFSPQEIALKRSVSGWVMLDVGVSLNPGTCQGLNSPDACPLVLAANFCQLVGIDLLTGAAFKFPKVVRAILKPLPPDAPQNK